MQSFIITIKANTIEATGPAGIRVEPQPFSWQPTPELAPTLAQLADESSRVPPEAVKKLGGALYDALFSREIAVAFSQAQSNVGPKNLRLSLQIEPPHLAALPWETIYHQADWLATDSSTPLVRRLPDVAGQSIQTLEVNRPLKVLFIGASPQGLDDLKVESQYAQLRNRLQEPISKKIIALDGLFHPTPDQLRQTLLKDYHIIYFAGHGAPEQVETSFDGTTQTRPATIFVNSEANTENRNGQPVPVLGQKYGLTADMMAGMLRGRQNTRLVFLAACNTSAITHSSDDSKSSDEYVILAGFAQELTSRAKLPAMVAMQYYISNMQAIPLTAHFFAAIAEFVPVDVALADARHTLIRRGEVGRDVFAPVMYLQAENATLFKKAWNKMALALAALLAVVVVLAGIGGYFLEGQRATEEQARYAAQTQEAIALVTSEARETARAAAQMTAEAEATQRVYAQETAAAESTAKAVEQARADSQELAALSETRLDNTGDGLVQSVLLAVESLKRYPSIEGNNTLRQSIALLAQPVFKSSNVIAISSDERLIAISSNDNVVSVIESVTEEELLKIESPSPITMLAFDIVGEKLALGQGNGVVEIWQVDEAQQLIRVVHDNEITALTFSSDGQMLITGSEDNTARLWDTTTGQELTRISHQDGVKDVVISPDNTKLATGSADGTAKIWDVTSNQEIARLFFEGTAWDVAFSMDSQLVAAGSLDDTATIYNANNGDLITKITHESSLDQHGGVKSVAFSFDSRFLATASADRTARIWNIETGQEVLQVLHGDVVESVAFSPDDKWLATGSADRTARIWNIETGQEISRLPHNDTVTQVNFSSKGRWLGTVAQNAWVWEGATNRDLNRMKHSYQSISSSDDGKWIVTQDDNTQTWWLWNGDTGREVRNLGAGDSAKIAPNGQWLAVVRNGLIQVIEIEGWQVILEKQGSGSILISPNSKFLLISSREGGSYQSPYQASLWNVSTGELVQESEIAFPLRFSPDSEWLLTRVYDGSASIKDIDADWNDYNRPYRKLDDVAYDENIISPDGQYLATQSARRMRLWNTAKKQELLNYEESVYNITFSPDSRFLAARSKNMTHVWQTSNGQEVARLDHALDIRNLSFSPDSNWLAGIVDREVKVWKVITNKEINRFVHKEPIEDFAFTRDSNWIATASKDNTAIVWETTTGQPIAQISHDSVNDVSFSDDGKWLFTSASIQYEELNSKVTLWKPEHLIEDACSRLPRNFTVYEWEQFFPNEAYYPSCANLPIPQNVSIELQTSTPTSQPTPTSTPQPIPKTTLSPLATPTPSLIIETTNQPPPHSLIAFINTKDHMLYTVYPDGSGMKKLPLPVNAVFYPQWSPNGQKIVFGTGGQIWIAKQDGDEAQLITEGDHPTWSPDGKQLAFDKQLENSYNRAVHIVDLETGHIRILAKQRWYPAWSPNGKIISFVESTSVGSNEKVHIISTDGSDLQGLQNQLRSFASEYIYNNAWSPDSRYVILDISGRSYGSQYGYETHHKIVEVSTGKSRVFNEQGSYGWASWAPDGQWIVFNRKVQNVLQLFIARVDGSDERQITFGDYGSYSPSWQPIELELDSKHDTVSETSLPTEDNSANQKKSDDTLTSSTPTRPVNSSGDVFPRPTATRPVNSSGDVLPRD